MSPANRRRSVWDHGIVLHIHGGEVAIHNRRVTLDERAIEHVQYDFLIAFHVCPRSLKIGPVQQRLGKTAANGGTASFDKDCIPGQFHSGLRLYCVSETVR
jgi:hypothetical protein